MFFAAERTFLAWIRTGLALMGFGFIVARFGLFLREAAAGAGIVLLLTGGARPSSTITARPGRVTVRPTIRF